MMLVYIIYITSEIEFTGLLSWKEGIGGGVSTKMLVVYPPGYLINAGYRKTDASYCLVECRRRNFWCLMLMLMLIMVFNVKKRL